MSESSMKILKFKKLTENAILPNKAFPSDACYDVSAPNRVVLKSGEITKVSLDFAVSCPDGYKLCLYSRSGLASKGILLTNSIGIVDPNYRGSLAAAFYNTSDTDFIVESGDRILQMAIEKIWEFKIEEVNELDETDRGSGGFGSSGIKKFGAQKPQILINL